MNPTRLLVPALVAFASATAAANADIVLRVPIHIAMPAPIANLQSFTLTCIAGPVNPTSFSQVHTAVVPIPVVNGSFDGTVSVALPVNSTGIQYRCSTTPLAFTFKYDDKDSSPLSKAMKGYVVTPDSKTDTGLVKL